MLILDVTATVGPFFEIQMQKLGAEPTAVETLDEAIELLQDIPEGEKQFDAFIIDANDLLDPDVQERLDAVDVPIVAYTQDMNNAEVVMSLGASSSAISPLPPPSPSSA